MLENKKRVKLICPNCNNSFLVLPHDVERRKYCSVRCKNEAQKGSIPWNKGLKGIHLSPKSEFKKGNKPWNTGKKLPEALREKLAKYRLGRPPSNKIYVSKEDLLDCYVNRKMSMRQTAERLGVSLSVVSRAMKEYKIKRRSLSEARRIGLETGRIIPWHKGKTGECKIFSDLRKKEWANPKLRNLRVRRSFEACTQKPNNAEKKLIEIIKIHELPFKYVGDGKTIINGRCPDFIGTKNQREIIELFGTYWHSPLFKPNLRKSRTYDATMKHYESEGYNCLIVWEDELSNPQMIVSMIENFSGI